MLSYPLTVNPLWGGGASLDHVFAITNWGSSSIVSSVAANNGTNPTTMRTSHDERKVKGVQVKGHMTQYAKRFRDDVTGTDQFLTVTLSVKRPQLSSVTAAECNTGIGMILTMWGTPARRDQMLNGEP
jgi:hypothetical protein